MTDSLHDEQPNARIADVPALSTAEQWAALIGHLTGVPANHPGIQEAAKRIVSVANRRAEQTPAKDFEKYPGVGRPVSEPQKPFRWR